MIPHDHEPFNKERNPVLHNEYAFQEASWTGGDDIPPHLAGKKKIMEKKGKNFLVKKNSG